MRDNDSDDEKCKNTKRRPFGTKNAGKKKRPTRR